MAMHTMRLLLSCRRGAAARELSTLSDQKELLQARSEEGVRFWMGSPPHTVRRAAAASEESAMGGGASPHLRSSREIFQDVWWERRRQTLNLTLSLTPTLASPEFKLTRWGTRGVPGTFAPVMLVAVMLSVAALALLIASTVHVREPDQEQVGDR